MEPDFGIAPNVLCLQGSSIAVNAYQAWSLVRDSRPPLRITNTLRRYLRLRGKVVVPVGNAPTHGAHLARLSVISRTILFELRDHGAEGGNATLKPIGQ